MNTSQIAALDRQKTAVLVWGGILEEHGPYLPSFTDGYINEYLTRSLAKAIAARPGWAVLVFPPVPLGTTTADSIGGRRQFPGSYGVREATLRAVFVDIASAIGAQGFRWVFVVHGHGAPSHNRALDAAAAHFNRSYGGRMVHLSGIADIRGKCGAVVERHLARTALAEDARSPHAGASETSLLLALRGELVDRSYADARPLPAPTRDATTDIARRSDWQGYFGSPRTATAALGEECLEVMTAGYNDLAIRVLDGFDDSTLSRYTTSWGFFATDAFLWSLTLLAAVWLTAVGYVTATSPRWLRAWAATKSRWSRALRLLPTTAAIAFAVATLVVLRASVPFRLAALLSLPPDPTYTMFLLSIATIMIGSIRLVFAATRALTQPSKA
jgi:creatinine amidohydrolase/Fe(II)-dependent formamide hydrolase-like protein